MEWFQILQLAQSILVGLGAAVAWVWARQRKSEQALLDGRFERLIERQDKQEEESNRRFEHINKQLSTRLMPMLQELISRMDRMPDDLRLKFLPLDRAMDLIEESQRDRKALWEEIEKRGGRGHAR